MSLTPMTIHISSDDITDLRRRLQQTRWPPRVEPSGWAAGTDADYLRELADYWASDYDWREREARLNRFSHFTTEVHGTTIHLIRASGRGPRPVPLLLMQGWPSSFVQMLDIIPLLIEDRNDGTPCFDVVAASLPGYPFSGFPAQPGMSFNGDPHAFARWGDRASAARVG